MNKSLTSKLGSVAIATIGGLTAACSSVPQRVDFTIDETVKTDYSSNGFQISKKPAAFTTLTASANTSFGSVSAYGTDITCRHDKHPHEYDLGISASFKVNDNETITAGADRYMFPNIGDLDASKEGWLELATTRTAPYVNRAALKYTDARWGSGEGNLVKLSFDKDLDVLGGRINLTGGLVRNNGYFIGDGNTGQFAEFQATIPVYTSDDKSFSASIFGKRIEAFGNKNLVDSDSAGFSLTWNFGGIKIREK